MARRSTSSRRRSSSGESQQPADDATAADASRSDPSPTDSSRADVEPDRPADAANGSDEHASPGTASTTPAAPADNGIDLAADDTGLGDPAGSADPAASGGGSAAGLSSLMNTVAGMSFSGDPSGSFSRPRGARPTSTSGADAALATPRWLGKRVGRFRLIGVIGKGAMGKVFRAEDVQLHRVVALKVISSRSTRKRSAAQKWELFLREARSAAKLEHPNLVSVYEVSSYSDIHFIAMELVEGGNLKDLVTAAGPMDVPRACQLAAEAAEGLQHAHEQNVIHRDVKPANLMLTRNGRCKIGDFGLARIDDPAEAGDTGLGRAVGTPQFVAPEVILGDEATALSDVYSLGATLFYLLTGVPPFSGSNSKDVMRKHVEELPPDLRTLRPDAPDSLALAIWRAMGKVPSGRFETAGHFARALRMHTIQVDGQHDDAAGPYHPQAAAASGSWLDRQDPRKVVLVSLLGGGMVLAALVAAAVWANRPPDPNAAAAASAARSRAFAPATLPKRFFDDDSPAVPSTAAAAGPTTVSAATADVPALAAPPPLPRPADVLPAADAATLMRVATLTDPTRHPGSVVVEGYVQRVAGWAGAGAGDGDFVVEFYGVDRKAGLLCTFGWELLPALWEQFGDDPAVALAGKRVRVAGTVVPYGGRPMIVLRSAGQIERAGAVAPATLPTTLPSTVQTTLPATRR